MTIDATRALIARLREWGPGKSLVSEAPLAAYKDLSAAADALEQAYRSTWLVQSAFHDCPPQANGMVGWEYSGVMANTKDESNQDTRRLTFVCGHCNTVVRITLGHIGEGAKAALPADRGEPSTARHVYGTGGGPADPGEEP